MREERKETRGRERVRVGERERRRGDRNEATERGKQFLKKKK